MATDRSTPAMDPSKVGSEDYLTSLTRRIDILEKKLVGSSGMKEDHPPLVNTLNDLSKKLDSTFGKAGQEKATAIWSKISTLEKLLTPDYANSLKVSEDERRELLLGYVRQLKPFCEQVEDVQKLKDYLNATEFQGLDDLEKKLASVAKTHTKEEQVMEEVGTQIKNLLETYQKMMLQLSAQCVAWGETLDRLESQGQQGQPGTSKKKT